VGFLNSSSFKQGWSRKGPCSKFQAATWATEPGRDAMVLELVVVGKHCVEEVTTPSGGSQCRVTGHGPPSDQHSELPATNWFCCIQEVIGWHPQQAWHHESVHGYTSEAGLHEDTARVSSSARTTSERGTLRTGWWRKKMPECGLQG
jgi:hypothetical protein